MIDTRSASSVAKRRFCSEISTVVPLCLEALEPLQDCFDHQRREALGGLVEQQEAGVTEQRARDGDHALLAAGERAGALAEKALHVGKQRQDLIEGPAALPRARRAARGLEVLGDRQAGEEAAVLRHEAEAGAAGLERLAPADLDAVEADRAGARPHQPHDAGERRGLAGAVAPEERDDFAALHADRETEEDLTLAVRGLKSSHFKERHPGQPPARAFFTSSQLRATDSVLTALTSPMPMPSGSAASRFTAPT